MCVCVCVCVCLEITKGEFWFLPLSCNHHVISLRIQYHLIFPWYQLSLPPIHPLLTVSVAAKRRWCIFTGNKACWRQVPLFSLMSTTYFSSKSWHDQFVDSQPKALLTAYIITPPPSIPTHHHHKPSNPLRRILSQFEITRGTSQPNQPPLCLLVKTFLSLPP